MDALRERGLGVGLYHSLIDWHHPQFPIDGLHPLRDDPEALAGQPGRDIAVYRDYLHGQVRELLTRFGPIDAAVPRLLVRRARARGEGGLGRQGRGRLGRPRSCCAMVRELQPGILVNDRLGSPRRHRHARAVPAERPPMRRRRPVLWEACQTLNGTWGYDRDNRDFKSVELLLRMLVDTVAKDGNLLLNVGPNARGEIDPVAVGTLRGIGRVDAAARPRRSTAPGRAAYAPPPDCRYTQRGDRLYLHLFAWPFETVHLPGLAGRVEYAQFLHDGSEVTREVHDNLEVATMTDEPAQPPGTLTLRLPVRRPDVEIPVVELFLRS